MKNKIKVGIIGMGNIGGSLALALAKSDKYKIYAFDLVKDTRFIKAKCVCWRDSCKQVINQSDYVVLAVKPQEIDKILQIIKNDFIQSKIVLVSVAAGVSLRKFERALPGAAVIRCMPNLALKVNQSVTFLAKGKKVSARGFSIVSDMFKVVGATFVITEKFMDKVTAISGSGPGYIYYFMSILYERAVDFGFTKAAAKKMVLQTFKGATALAEDTGWDFDKLQSAVTSSKGTTDAALKVFKKGKVRVIIKDGISAAYNRAKELSG